MSASRNKMKDTPDSRREGGIKIMSQPCEETPVPPTCFPTLPPSPSQQLPPMQMGYMQIQLEGGGLQVVPVQFFIHPEYLTKLDRQGLTSYQPAFQPSHYNNTQRRHAPRQTRNEEPSDKPSWQQDYQHRPPRNQQTYRRPQWNQEPLYRCEPNPRPHVNLIREYRERPSLQNRQRAQFDYSADLRHSHDQTKLQTRNYSNSKNKNKNSCADCGGLKISFTSLCFICAKRGPEATMLRKRESDGRTSWRDGSLGRTARKRPTPSYWREEARQPSWQRRSILRQYTTDFR